MSDLPFKAVIPAAGLGTRFLPATKAMPKEMLPVVDKPAIQYVVEEAATAGIQDVLIIIGRNKNNIANHFDSVPELEQKLREKGDGKKLAAVEHSSDLAEVHMVRQGEPKGLGHAVLRAKSHVGNHPFAVLLGDDLIDERDPLLVKMLDEHRRTGAAIVALMEVDPEQIHLYGCAVAAPTDDPDVVTVGGLVEKPAKEDAPSNLAIIGRYVLAPTVFDVLEHTEPGKGGEIQLTDAIATLMARKRTLAYRFQGRRFDCGSRIGLVEATIEFALDHEDLAEPAREYMRAALAR